MWPKGGVPDRERDRSLQLGRHRYGKIPGGLELVSKNSQIRLLLATSHGVGQAGAVEVVFARLKDLRLGL